MPDSNHYILDLISQGEHQQLDFKFVVSDTKKIARSLSAFANTVGGTLLIGVKDNGAIAGVRSDEEYHMIEAAAAFHTKPEVEFTAKKHIVKGKTVLEIKVPPSENRPHSAPDPKYGMRAFYRVADENKIAHPAHFMAWIKQKNKVPAQIIYSESEKFLLDYLSNHDGISSGNYVKYAGINAKKATNILSDMLNLNLVQIVYRQEDIYFKISD